MRHPELWSPESPALYKCTVTLKSTHGEQQVTESFGVRSFEWVEHGPFKLNGTRLLLRGTHYHEDHAGVGAAVPDDVVRQTLQQIKDMGANFVRLGHYQQAPLVLDECDELGLLVWEEIPWCRGGLGGERFRQQCRDMLHNMIDQHSNHPSVILWGLGNEDDWPGDFETFNAKAIREFMTELNMAAHQLDPSRSTVIRRCDFCKDIADVYSPSIWAGLVFGTLYRIPRGRRKEPSRPHPMFSMLNTAATVMRVAIRKTRRGFLRVSRSGKVPRKWAMRTRPPAARPALRAMAIGRRVT